MQQRIFGRHISKGENYYYEKQTKLLAVLSARSSYCSPFFSCICQNAGWAQENGNWYYYDSMGALTDTWKNPAMTVLSGFRRNQSHLQIDEYYVDERKTRYYEMDFRENEITYTEQDGVSLLLLWKRRKSLNLTWASINGQWYISTIPSWKPAPFR